MYVYIFNTIKYILKHNYIYRADMGPGVQSPCSPRLLLRAGILCFPPCFTFNRGISALLGKGFHENQVKQKILLFLFLF